MPVYKPPVFTGGYNSKLASYGHIQPAISYYRLSGRTGKVFLVIHLNEEDYFKMVAKRRSLIM